MLRPLLCEPTTTTTDPYYYGSTTTTTDPYYYYGTTTTYPYYYYGTTTTYPYYYYGTTTTYPYYYYGTTTTYPYDYYYGTTTTPGNIAVAVDDPCVDDSSTTTSVPESTTSSSTSSTVVATSSSVPTPTTSAVTSSTIEPANDLGELAGRNIRSGSLRTRLNGDGLRPNSRVVIEAHSDTYTLWDGNADAGGAFDVVVSIPADLEPGDHSLVVLGVDPFGNPVQVVSRFGISTDGTFLLAAAEPSALPATGSDSTSIVVWANMMFFLGLGIALLAYKERRKYLLVSE
jgi:hypothetical protein